MPDFFQTFFNWSANHPILLAASIFVIAFLECLALFGILFPGVVLLVSVTLIAANSDLPLWLTLLMASSGAFSANLASYTLGAKLQSKTEKLGLLRKNPVWLVHAQLYLQNYGSASIFFAQFVGLLRPLLPMVAGMVSVPRQQFSIIILFASLCWSALFILPAWFTGTAMHIEPPDGFWLQTLIPLLEFLSILMISYHLTRRQHQWRYAAITITASLLLLTLIISLPWLSQFDAFVLDLAQQLHTPALDKLMLISTLVADRYIQLALCALLCLFLLVQRAWAALFFTAGSILAGYGATLVLKYLLQRSRPEVLLEPLSGGSFPSGHSARGFLFFLIIAILLNRGLAINWRILTITMACVLASLVAFSRFYLGAHWPTDTMAGALIAIAACGFSLTVLQPKCPPTQLGAAFWYKYFILSGVLLVAAIIWQLPAAMIKYQL